MNGPELRRPFSAPHLSTHVFFRVLHAESVLLWFLFAVRRSVLICSCNHSDSGTTLRCLISARFRTDSGHIKYGANGNGVSMQALSF